MDKTETLVAKANILIEALPYIQKLYGKTVVIKYGGNAMKNEILTRTILQDITMLKYCGVNPIVVHGGGPDISAMLKKLNIETKFVGGLRVTDEATMEVVQMVLCGKINKDIVAHMGALGGKAIGLRQGRGNSSVPTRSWPRTARISGSWARSTASIFSCSPPCPLMNTSLSSLPSASGRTARPTTSTRTPWPGKSPRRSTRKS